MQPKQVPVVQEGISKFVSTSSTSGNASSGRLVSASGGAFDSCSVENRTVLSNGSGDSAVHHG